MPKKSRSPNWFEGELVLGQTVTFTTPVYSRWRVTEIIQDRQYSFIDTDPEESDVEVSINNSTPPTNSLHPQPSVYNAKVSIESAQPSIDKVEPKDGERSSIDTTPTASEGKPSSEKSEVEAGDRNPASAATSAAKEEEGGGGSGGGRTEKRRYEACAVFKCTRIDKDKNAQPTDQTGAAGLPRVGILKVRIQIPAPGTETTPAADRRPQATIALTRPAVREIEALTTLTTAQCTSTPRLLAWKQGRQNSDSGVPGGYIVYVVMGVLPGVRIVNVFRELGREEREEFRRGFKEAWLECKEKGVINQDRALRNLLWDVEKKRCYILDFELYRKPTEEDVWDDSLYLDWNLAYLNDGDPNDMSTWDL